jgi:16S rRNA processing protein RimM
MKKDELFLLGKIVRTFGSKGEVIIQFDAELLTLIKKLESVFLKLNENLVPFFIEYTHPRSRNQVLVKFMDDDNTDEAFSFTGCEVYIPSGLIPRQKRTKLFSFEIEGYRVIDVNHGETGIVSAILELPQQSLLSVDSNGKEILLPIVEDFIKEVDRRNRIIYTEAPEGLIELYLG